VFDKTYFDQIVFDGIAVTIKDSSDTGSGVDAKVTGNPVAVYLQSETGGGIDGHKAVAPQSIGETGSGIDALTALFGILAQSDTGLGTDAKLALAVALIKADAGSGIESILGRALVLVQAGIGEDLSHLVKTLLLSDTGSAAENSYLHILEGVKDSHETGSGVDTSTLTALFQQIETGLGAEAVVARALYAKEYPTGAIDLAKVLVAAITKSETGTGAEASLVSYYQKGAETGTGVDVSTLAAMFTKSDSGSGVEAITLLAAMLVSDTGIGIEEILTYLRKLVDSGVGSEVVQLIGFIGRLMKLKVYTRPYSNLKVHTRPYSNLKVYTAEVRQT